MIIGGIILIAILAFLFMRWVTPASATQENKVYWCHTEPNGNQQTLHLPLAALQNAGHVDANGNPLHAGDHPGECVEPTATPTNTPSVTPTPTEEPCIELEDGSEFAIKDEEVVPCLSVTPSPTPEPSATPEPTTPPSPHGDGLSDGKSDGKSTPQPTLIPCSATTCGWK